MVALPSPATMLSSFWILFPAFGRRAVEGAAAPDGPGPELPPDGVGRPVQRGLPLRPAVVEEGALHGRLPRELRRPDPQEPHREPLRLERPIEQRLGRLPDLV